ncbi:MAG: carbohydrate ABC transporter permease [Ferrimicrobium sp.]|uniref:Carbohydrate ABC transporter permease n=1 Tax=Ferrimicrobium acidiphilum TaxID=121039 RepID=A0ABV3Y740_9ACTN|nr:carbohydrate ABC transporter permease [Ferrimicrobium sp.]
MKTLSQSPAKNPYDPSLGMRILTKGPKWIAVTAVAVLFAFPLYWVVVTAFNTKHGVYAIPPHFLPQFHTSPFMYVLTHTSWLGYMLNTVFISGSTVVLVIITSAMAGYALADLRFRGSGAVLAAVLAVILLPAQALLVPQYAVALHLHLLNTYWVQIIPFAASTFGVLLFRQFFKTLPRSYWEAAQLEGVGHLRYVFRIALPLARPAVVTVALLTFITSWNQFQWPLIMTTSHSVQPIEIALSHYMQTFEANWRKLTSAVLLALAPIVIVFLLLQRYIVDGVAGRDSGVNA